MARRAEDTLSMPALIKALDEGDTYSKTRRVAVGTKEAKDLNAVLFKLRNVVNQGVSRIRKEVPGSNFRVESGVALTDDKAAHLCVVGVTRIEDEEAVDI